MEMLQGTTTVGVFTRILGKPFVAFQHKLCLTVLSHQRSRFLIALVESGCPSHPVLLSGARGVHETRYDL
ncbi:hypothetical protein T02_8678 [Trichinella nativa]|uniref:Uncharacterized protein n=1 Tax=Trichinella nativa TaxID=6335 RepID=A0A0V1KPL8_9BILA|nr:hypothetical protein T02_8678 [Trichinella nativa]